MWLNYQPYLECFEYRNNGFHYIYTFDNGYKASLICTPYSYGGDRGMWEGAVLDREDNIVSTSCTVCDDVKGYMNFKEAEYFLQKVKELPTSRGIS